LILKMRTRPRIWLKINHIRGQVICVGAGLEKSFK